MPEKTFPHNNVKNVGFYEGQLLANGATAEQSAEISANLIQGEEPKPTGEERLDRVAQRLYDGEYNKQGLYGDSQ